MVMPYLVMLLSAIAGVGFWWWRLKAMGEAASEIHDAAGRVIGKYKRHKFRQKVEGATLTAVSDPVAAAIIMMIAIAQEDRPLDDETEAAIRQEAVDTMGQSNPVELMIFSKWVASNVADANDVSYAYRKLWTDNLTVDERRDLVAMVQRIASLRGGPTPSQKSKLEKLSERLGFQKGR
jgi:uncharacterized membrane protein